MEYDQYKAEDFIMDESFQQYCLGISKDAEDFWTKWLSENPDKMPEVKKAEQLYLLINGNNTAQEFKADKTIFNERLKKELNILIGDEAKVIPMPTQKRSGGGIYRWIAAAAVLIVFVGGYLMINNKKSENEVATENKKIEIKNSDILPGGNKAILTLSDGRQIILDSMANGDLAEQNGIKVIKIGGQIAYNPKTVSSGELVYNTITTPRGGLYQLILADGSKVWLNAASSIRFPVAFVGNERKVEITGEAYFEVASLSAKGGQEKVPFIVSVASSLGDGRGMQVEVLGTHFNINAYNDEPLIKTTLLEGKVKVVRNGALAVLKPGQQAQSSINSSAIQGVRVLNNINISEVVAWKNGYFEFNQADIQTVMRQLARWYNIEVEYSGNIPKQTFGGEIQRNLKLSQVLKVLEKSNVHFKIQGYKIIVLP